jgi:pimeloyl-ACP methyl ester carboxylesterase
MRYRLGFTGVIALTAAVVVAQQGSMLNVGDAMIHYAVSGSGDAIVMLPGWTQDMSIWEREAEALSARYRVIRMDRRGYGRSTGHADPTADPADVLALLDSLGIQRATILGLSAGAGAAVSFGRAYPDRTDRLVLYGLGPIEGFPGSGSTRTAFQNFANVARTKGLDSLWTYLMTSGMFWRPPGSPIPGKPAYWLRYDGRDLLDPQPPSGKVAPAQWSRISSLTMPILVIQGEHDMPPVLAIGDSIATRLPNARRVVIPDAGHGAHFDQPEPFLRALRDFLSSTPVRR